MRFYRSGGKPDASQMAILKTAKRLGATYQIVSVVPRFVDAVIGFQGLNLLWEIKTPGGRGRKKKTEEGQQNLRATWRGRIDVVETEAQAVQALLDADRTRPDLEKLKNEV